MFLTKGTRNTLEGYIGDICMFYLYGYIPQRIRTHIISRYLRINKKKNKELNENQICEHFIKEES